MCALRVEYDVLLHCSRSITTCTGSLLHAFQTFKISTNVQDDVVCFLRISIQVSKLTRYVAFTPPRSVQQGYRSMPKEPTTEIARGRGRRQAGRQAYPYPRKKSRTLTRRSPPLRDSSTTSAPQAAKRGFISDVGLALTRVPARVLQHVKPTTGIAAARFV